MRQSDLLLCHILVRACSQLLGKLALFALLKFGSEYRLHATRWKRRLHHDGIEMVENPVERGRLAAPPGRDGRKFQFLSSQVS